MNKIFILIVLTSIFFACNSDGNSSSGAANNEYLIRGTILNAGGKPVYLDKVSLVSNYAVVDTAIIAKDGSFTMKGNIEEKGLYLLRVAKDKNWMLVLDKGQVQFSADLSDIYNYKIEGSPEAMACAAFIVKAGENQRVLNIINKQFNKARMTGDGRKIAKLQGDYQKRLDLSQNYLRSLADTSPYPLIGIFAANLLPVDDNITFLDRYIKELEKTLPNSSYVKELKGKVGTVANLNIGREAPDFTLKTPQGKDLSLSEMKGKVTLIDFWASWCRPCRADNPRLVKLYDKYKDKGFDVYSVSLDKRLDRWVKAIESDNLKWKNHGSNLIGWQCAVARTYKVTSIPNTYLIDKEGKIIAKNLRGPALERKLEEIFGS